MERVSDPAAGDAEPGEGARGLEARLAALVSLIADSSPQIRAATAQAVLDAGEPVLPFLESAAEAGEARLRVRARSLLLELQSGLHAAEIARIGPELDVRPGALEDAVILLVRTRDRHVDAEDIKGQLDAIAARLGSELRDVHQPREQAAVLRRVLAEENGLRGNLRNYYDVENSYIDRVLERRLGIPVTLGAVYLFVARRTGLSVESFGGPGRFLLRISGPPALFLDPFRSGAVTESPDGLRPMSDRDVLVRMIGNLQLVHRGRCDGATLKGLDRLRTALEESSRVAGS